MTDRPSLNRRDLVRAAAFAPIAFGAASCATALPARPSAAASIWTFDRLADIGGHPTRVEGAPALIDSPWGKATKFDGADDALFIDNHPLAGAETFAFEAVFRPDGGAFEQRWFHLAMDEAPAAPGVTLPGTRFLFEIRVVEDRWYLDAFTKGPTYNVTLIDPARLFPVGQWHHVAQTYDGTTYRSFVNGVLQDEAPLAFTPHGPGRSSVGCRFNRVNYFNGAVREARFTPAFVAPDRFANPFG